MPSNGRQDRGVPNCFVCGETLKLVVQQITVPCEDCQELRRDRAGKISPPGSEAEAA